MCLKKQNKISFVEYIIGNIMENCMFTINNPYSNLVEIFDSEGNYVICSNDNLVETINSLEKELLITMWRGSQSIDLIFYFYDDKYDILDISFDGLKEAEYNQIINDISIAIINNNQRVIGMMIDKKGILPEICFKYKDNMCLDFMLNSKSQIRKEVCPKYKSDISLRDLIEEYHQIYKRIGDICIFTFLTEEQLMLEFWEYK